MNLSKSDLTTPQYCRSQSNQTRFPLLIAGILTALLMVFTSCTPASAPKKGSPGERATQLTKRAATGSSKALREKNAKLAEKSVSIFIEPGDLSEAQKYYNRISQRLGLRLLDQANNILPEANLTELINYLGYEGLVAGDLEALPSADLMPRDSSGFTLLSQKVSDSATFVAKRTLADFANDNVLVSRFFAPKIVDYTKVESPTATQHYTPGWRKLVRLKPLPNSRASAADIDTTYILFNFVRDDVSLDPFDKNFSKNNQVIIVPKKFQNGAEDSAYFLVYLQAPENKLGFALSGVAFDLPGAKDYHVPRSCAQCHGHDGRSGNSSPGPADGIYRQARVNYLDTDQWHDAINFDFPQLSGTPWAVVFDGGNDVQSSGYHLAMDVMRKLNAGARAQNKTVDETDFKFQAADKWIQLHTNQDGPVPFTDRVFGASLWNATNPDEKELLSLLNHYCFRCHSSIRYNVFDKQGVNDSSGGFASRLNAATNSPRYMPQGRKLPTDVKNRIIELSEKLFP